MVKLVILYKHPKDEDAFEQGYVNSLALLEKMPGIIRQQANIVLGNPEGRSPYYRILELYFDSYDNLDAALRSPEGVAAGRLLMSFAGDLVELLFVDVFEDDLSKET
ncbi:MAG: EthD family reductase [Chloroflexi bacterium]|nr:EthD family reductase [Chloroflexota bacterium]